MMAFDHLFMDVARREGLAVTMTDASGRSATVLFREFYCHEPRCDCRRVVLLAHWVEGRRIAASINFAFDRPSRRGESQMFLDPMNPQSEIADEVFSVFGQVLADNPLCRERFERHYAMWKRVVDDPSHPDHARVRTPEHGDPSFKPAFARRGARPRSRREKQPAPGSASLTLLGGQDRRESDAQKRFRKLLDKVERLRRRVGEWGTGRPAIDREVAIFTSQHEAQGRLLREMVTALDRAHGEASWTKADRRRMSEVIASIALELLEERDPSTTGDGDLVSLYNRHGRGDFEAEAAAEQAMHAEVARAMMETMGIQFGDADVSSMEKLQAFVQDQVQADATAKDERRARRRRTARQREVEDQREREAREASKALQDLYRGLAMALHPDREADTAERARKNALMQEVNVAYEARDLLTLLELQLRFERVDAARIDSIAEERVRRYCRILGDQARQLADELAELEGPWRAQLDLAPRARLSPARVIEAIRADTASLQRRQAELRRHLEAFRDPRALKAWLRAETATARKGGDPFDLVFG